MNINGKKILLVSPQYYGYEQYIRRELEERGAEVILVSENINETSLYYRFVYVYLKPMKQRALYSYYRRKLKKHNGFDYVFIIRGSSIDRSTLSYIKNKSKKECKYVMYQWDAVKNNPSCLEISKEFDKVLTFDMDDAKKYRWKYRPLFFIDKLTQKADRDIDILYVCGLHSRRAQILNLLKCECKKNNWVLVSHLLVKKIIFYKKKCIDHDELYASIDVNSVRFKQLSILDSYILYSRSKVVVDYTHPDQNGYTMRTIECLGNGCKLITNNRQILNADFYNPDNIHVFEEDDDFLIPENFVNSPYSQNKIGITESYSLKKWIDDIFEGIIHE